MKGEGGCYWSGRCLTDFRD